MENNRYETQYSGGAVDTAIRNAPVYVSAHPSQSFNSKIFIISDPNNAYDYLMHYNETLKVWRELGAAPGVLTEGTKVEINSGLENGEYDSLKNITLDGVLYKVLNTSLTESKKFTSAKKMTHCLVIE